MDGWMDRKRDRQQIKCWTEGILDEKEILDD